jgi:hypothetical protein
VSAVDRANRLGLDDSLNVGERHELRSAQIRTEPEIRGDPWPTNQQCMINA